MRRSRLPSGWTPIELLKHLTYMKWRCRHLGHLDIVCELAGGSTGE